MVNHKERKEEDIEKRSRKNLLATHERTNMAPFQIVISIKEKNTLKDIAKTVAHLMKNN